MRRRVGPDRQPQRSVPPTAVVHRHDAHRTRFGRAVEELRDALASMGVRSRGKEGKSVRHPSACRERRSAVLRQHESGMDGVEVPCRDVVRDNGREGSRPAERSNWARLARCAPGTPDRRGTRDRVVPAVDDQLDHVAHARGGLHRTRQLHVHAAQRRCVQGAAVARAYPGVRHRAAALVLRADELGALRLTRSLRFARRRLLPVVGTDLCVGGRDSQHGTQNRAGNNLAANRKFR